MIADHYELAVSRQMKKQAVKAELLAALVEKGILPQLQSVPETPEQSCQTSGEAVRLKELEVELQRLALKDKELNYLSDLEMKKLDLRMRELELGVASQVSSRSSNFDVSRNIRLVPLFNEKDVDNYLLFIKNAFVDRPF